MTVDIRFLFKRFNQFGEYADAIPVIYQGTMIQIYKEARVNPKIDFERRIIEIEHDEEFANFEEHLYDSKMVQPKSVILRFYYLRIIVESMGDAFFERHSCTRKSIIELTIAIAMYYLGIQENAFSECPMTETEKTHLISSADGFYLTEQGIRKVRGNTKGDEFDNYMSLFAKEIVNLNPKEDMGLFCDGKGFFILCITEFLDYIILAIEKMYKSEMSHEAIEEYYHHKAMQFESFVHIVCSQFFDEVYHTVFFQPNSMQKNELDVLIRGNDEQIMILECKSGTVDIEKMDKEFALREKVKNKTRKAYKTLKGVADYCAATKKYSFKHGDDSIDGCCDKPYCIHISMYPMDFVSSNLHVLFPDYLNTENPILSFSLEHFIAIMIECRDCNSRLFDYLELRRNLIISHPKKTFDYNELDLFFELTNEKSMLREMINAGQLDEFKDNVRLMATFRNEYGDEVRPAMNYIKRMDSILFYSVLRYGKRNFNINRRYLKNLESYFERKMY